MRLLSDLLELVFPADCPGCGTSGAATPLCVRCERAVRTAPARPVRPHPAPAGLPRCAAVGAYHGVLRELLLAYKERRRLGLAGLLGAALATAVRTLAVPGAGVILVPVPATAAAARARGGDHVRRLARHAVSDLRRRGWPATVCSTVAATPRVPDSAGLDAPARARRAMEAFRARPMVMAGLAASAGGVPDGAHGGRSRPISVVVVDDIITTGATLAAVSALLAGNAVPVAGAAVLAATRRRRPPSLARATGPPGEHPP